MIQTYRSSILPLVAFVFTILAFCYSACEKSVARQKSETSATELVDQVRTFERTLNELKTIHAAHVKQYSGEMGCNRDSKALVIINRHNELLNKHSSRLQYHKMQLEQADTSDAERNKEQLLELKKDLDQLSVDGNEIRTGFDSIEPTHVTK